MSHRTLLDAREKRFVEYIKEKRVTSEIATREGLEEDYVRKERLRIAALVGLPITQGKALDTIPYGLDDETRTFRGKLANKLYDLTGKHHPAELARTLGVPQKAQRKARERPFGHDWTLGQLQRLAKAEGKTFAQLMKEVL